MTRNMAISVFLFFAFGINMGAAGRNVTVTSPSGKIQTVISGIGVHVAYSVKHGDFNLMKDSKLSMTVDGKQWGTLDKPYKITRKHVEEEIRYEVPRKYKEKLTSYNEATLCFKEYDIQFRVYEEGVAYRFVGKEDRVGKVESEEVEYVFDPTDSSYVLLTKNPQNWFEEQYTYKPLSELPLDSISIMPTMTRINGCCVLIAEADLHDYSGMFLRPTGNGFEGVLPSYPSKEQFFNGTEKLYATEREDYIVRCNLKRSFPWHVMGVYDSDAGILSSELIYDLSEKTKDDYSWVKPGKVIWDWWNGRNIYNVGFKSGINTDTYLYLVDFAAEYHIPYFLIDAGWSAEDDLLALNPDVDMPKICSYAKEKGVGILLWAKWINMDRQMDEAFKEMSEWGVKGVKIDYMDRNDAKMVNFYERIASKAAGCKMIVDFHGAYPNEGMRALYPNLLTREGVIGMEYDRWSTKATPKHEVTIPFLRMWVGPMDYTPGAMLNAQPGTFYPNQIEPESQGTRAHQAAMYVVYESPLQMLSDSPTKYIENKDCFTFINSIPTIWDETFPLSGRVGEYVAVARRSGDKWYVGVMGGNSEMDLEIGLNFLSRGEYSMVSLSDGINAAVNGKDYKLSIEHVEKGQSVHFHLAPGGGYAAIISKQ